MSDLQRNEDCDHRQLNALASAEVSREKFVVIYARLTPARSPEERETLFAAFEVVEAMGSDWR
jgi:hypothetical protein